MYDKEFEKYFEADIEFPQMELPEESELDEAKFKKGDIVIPDMGPHKGEKHTIILDFKNGSYNISLNKKYSKYDQGAAKAKEKQLKLVKEEAPANSVASGNVNLDPHIKKKRKNAKVQTEMFGGQKVFVVSPERFFDSRLGKARYARYEKYVGNDKLGEAIRTYGRNNPKNSIILKNSGNGAMLYLKYGRK